MTAAFKLALMLMGSVGVGAACADPSYTKTASDSSTSSSTPLGPGQAASDAGPSLTTPVEAGEPEATTAVSDGGIVAGPDVPEAAKPLIGTYALRTRYFARDAATRGQLIWHETLYLAEVTWDGSAVKMAAHICADRGASSPLDTMLMAFRPQSWGTRDFTIAINGAAFSTTSPAATIGYDATVAECTAGTVRIPARSDQVWNTAGTCACPSSDAAPTTLDDCRITDPDDDMRPGVTTNISGLVVGYAGIRVRDNSQLVDGVIDPSRHHRAGYQRNEDTWELVCNPDTCTHGSYLFCSPSLSPAELVPLAEDGPEWTCDRLVAQPAGTFFSTGDPVFPYGC